MVRPKSALPQMPAHLSGQGFVRIGDRNFYLGKYASPESLARYAVLIAEYQANNLTLPKDFDFRAIDARAGLLLAKEVELPPEHFENKPIQMRHVTAAYREYSKVAYVKSKAELCRILLLCDELDLHDGNLQADEYGPKALYRFRILSRQICFKPIANCIDLEHNRGWQYFRTSKRLHDCIAIHMLLIVRSFRSMVA